MSAHTPVTCRPRSAMIMTGILAVVLLGGSAWLWLAVGPETRARVSWVQWLTLGIFLVVMVGLLLAIGLSYVRADDTGLTYRNLLGRRRLAWSEIDRLRFNDGDPFAYAYLVAGHPRGRERVQLLGIQQSDGEHGRRQFQALRERQPQSAGQA